MFDEVDCKFELKRAKKYIKKQSDIILALEKKIRRKRKRNIINKTEREK